MGSGKGEGSAGAVVSSNLCHESDLLPARVGPSRPSSTIHQNKKKNQMCRAGGRSARMANICRAKLLHLGVYSTVKSHINTVLPLVNYNCSLGLGLAKIPQRAHKTLRVPDLCPTVRDPSPSLSSPFLQVPILNVSRTTHHKDGSLRELGAPYGRACSRQGITCRARVKHDVFVCLLQRLVRSRARIHQRLCQPCDRTELVRRKEIPHARDQVLQTAFLESVCEL